MVKQSQYLTPEGLANLEKRLTFFREVRRPEVSSQLRQVLEEGGDLAENTAYLDVKNEQGFVEGEIARLEQIIRYAQIIEHSGNHDSVQIGSMVTVVEKGTKDTEVYHLVGSAEANPREGKVSVESPLGKTLLGAKKKDEVVVAAPDGDITFVVKKIN